jgi:SAF domain
LGYGVPVLLLSRPPYLRWAVASLIVIAAFAWDVSRRATEPYPFAARTITRGTEITEDVLRWEAVPRGTFTLPALDDVHALTDIREGDPVTSSVAGRGSVIPADWWAVPIGLPSGIARGTHVRITTLDGVEVEGIVAVAATQDQFGLATQGAVAVPEEAVSVVSLAAAADALVVVVAP